MNGGAPRRVAVVTGSRAELGLLKPIMRAIGDHPALMRLSVVTGTHLLPASSTVDEVRALFPIDACVPMQSSQPPLAAKGTMQLTIPRLRDALATGRGIAGLAEAFASLDPDIVLVLGDRIEAFAAASAASIGGIRVAHVHGGDRAEGIADESMRHAITKLAHVHFPATQQSADRIVRLGERPETVHLVGSPAMDDLTSFVPMNDDEFISLGAPDIILLFHPIGRDEAEEHADAAQLLRACYRVGRPIIMEPNHDPGREGIMRAITENGLPSHAHLPREKFIGLLSRTKVIVGNSSAGLIEAAAVGAWTVNVGPRQAGRERAGNVMDADAREAPQLATKIREVLTRPRYGGPHPYGDGRTGQRIAEILAMLDEATHPLAKRNMY